MLKSLAQSYINLILQSLHLKSLAYFSRHHCALCAKSTKEWDCLTACFSVLQADLCMLVSMPNLSTSNTKVSGTPIAKNVSGPWEWKWNRTVELNGCAQNVVVSKPQNLQGPRAENFCLLKFSLYNFIFKLQAFLGTCVISQHTALPWLSFQYLHLIITKILSTILAQKLLTPHNHIPPFQCATVLIVWGFLLRAVACSTVSMTYDTKPRINTSDFISSFTFLGSDLRLPVPQPKSPWFFHMHYLGMFMHVHTAQHQINTSKSQSESTSDWPLGITV